MTTKRDDLYRHVERAWDTIWTAYKDDLSEASQRSLRVQYQRARKNDEIVVFVRDNVKRKLVSYSLAAE